MPSVRSLAKMHMLCVCVCDDAISCFFFFPPSFRDAHLSFAVGFMISCTHMANWVCCVSYLSVYLSIYLYHVFLLQPRIPFQSAHPSPPSSFYCCCCCVDLSLSLWQQMAQATVAPVTEYFGKGDLTASLWYSCLTLVVSLAVGILYLVHGLPHLFFSSSTFHNVRSNSYYLSGIHHPSPPQPLFLSLTLA
jgi:hypothetical protein